MRPSVVVLSLVLAGCSAPQKERASEYFNLVPPVHVVDVGVDGHQVILPRGRALIVHLPEDPASGHRWEMQPFEPGVLIAPVKHDYVAAGEAGGPAAASEAGEGVFRLRGIAPGTQAVVLEYRRPLETAAAKTVRFDVVVQ